MGVADIISRVGGYMASFLPLLNFIGPLIVLQYIKELSVVLRVMMIREFFSFAKKYFETVVENLLFLVQTEKFDSEVVELIGNRINDIQ